MKKNIEFDEYLEALWHMKEDGRVSVEELKAEVGERFNPDTLSALHVDGLAEIYEEVRIRLTPAGRDKAVRIIRAHRLAERLMFDVMGVSRDIEEGACEFEHTVTPQLVDSICVMLGHPRECPHGLPIPPGECCKNASTTIETSVIHLTDLEVGRAARIAYINCDRDQDLHRLNGLQIRPGVTVKLHQTYPSFVIECEGSNIAIDDVIARNICVWREQKPAGINARVDESASAPGGEYPDGANASMAATPASVAKKAGIFKNNLFFRKCKKD
jgi:DtxR family Mn-dependent transcriptional regulator